MLIILKIIIGKIFLKLNIANNDLTKGIGVLTFAKMELSIVSIKISKIINKY